MPGDARRLQSNCLQEGEGGGLHIFVMEHQARAAAKKGNQVLLGFK